MLVLALEQDIYPIILMTAGQEIKPLFYKSDGFNYRFQLIARSLSQIRDESRIHDKPFSNFRHTGIN